MSAPPTVLSRVPPAPKRGGSPVVPLALAATCLPASIVASGALTCLLVRPSLYDRYGVGHGGWRTDLTAGTLALFILVVVVVSGRAWVRARRDLASRDTAMRAVGAILLLVGLWLGFLTYPLMRTGLAVASGSSSRSLSAAEVRDAVAQLDAQVQAPAGYRRGGWVCTAGYVCWTSPKVAFFTDSGYRALAQEFGVSLRSAHCDPPLVSGNGRGTQTCEGQGTDARYDELVLLEVRRDAPSEASTGAQISVAPLRQLG
jgi:hypothetical protein